MKELEVLARMTSDIVESAFYTRKDNGPGDKPNFEAINSDLLEDKSVISRILQCKEKIIALLSKELKIQRQDFKNQIDSLIKEKEELNLDLQRHLINEKHMASMLGNSNRANDLEKQIHAFEQRFTDTLDIESIPVLRRKIIELTTENNRYKIEIQSIQSMRRKNEEKIKRLEDDVKRVSEDLMGSKDALLQVFNVLLERQDQTLIEKIDRIVHEAHKPVLEY